MSYSMQIDAPHAGDLKKVNTNFPVTVQVMAHSSDPGSVLGLQFAADPEGPWASCEPIGESGAVQANAVAWSPQEQHFTLTARASEDAYIRAAIFETQDLEEDPLAVSSARFVNTVSVWPAPVPDL